MARGVDLIVPDWPAPDGVRAVSTTRTGGTSSGPYASLNLGCHVGDRTEAVRQNRARLAAKLDLAEQPRWLNQVHGTRIVRVEDVSEPVPADGTIASGIQGVCAIMTADCLPVLLCDHAGAHVAAVHGGWRGLAAGILETAIAEFGSRGVQPADMLCWLGPAIGATAYEVGAEVCDALQGDAGALTHKENGRWLLDLYGLARARLSRSGVENIYGGAFCTYTDADRFFSYRRDGACGRQATLIWRIG